MSETRRFLRFCETFALRAFKFCEGKIRRGHMKNSDYSIIKKEQCFSVPGLCRYCFVRSVPPILE